MKLPVPCLMLVTDRQRCAGRPLLELVRRAVAAGVDAVQVREKDLPDDALYELASATRSITAERCLLLINGRADIAVAVGADGVHLPANGLPVNVVRRLAPAGALVGCSVHSQDAALRAAAEGADYVQLGTIFATESKPGKAPDEVVLVRRATAGLEIPCLAVGGIGAANAASVLQAGAQGVAVVSAILEARNIESAVHALRRSLAEANRSRLAERA